MKQLLSKFSTIVERSSINREKRWEDFRAFHLKIVENISPELCEALGSMNKVCSINTSWAVEFTIKDYTWWGIKGSKNCNIVSLPTLKSKFREMLSNVLNNADVNVTLEESEEILDLINEL